MFTSRAEHRLILRQDNADRRLMELGHKQGLISTDMVYKLRKKENLIRDGITFSNQYLIKPEEVNPLLIKRGIENISESERLSKILKRPGVRLAEIVQVESIKTVPFFSSFRSMCDDNAFAEIIEQIEIELKYEGYVKRQQEEIEKFDRLEELPIPRDIDYERLKALSTEGREKLKKVRPISIGQASRISGITPADVSILMVYLRN